MRQETAMNEQADSTKVICPNCTCQFRAIPVEVQEKLAEQRRRILTLESAVVVLRSAIKPVSVKASTVQGIYAALGLKWKDDKGVEAIRRIMKLQGEQPKTWWEKVFGFWP
jgi:hypothetical protein